MEEKVMVQNEYSWILGYSDNRVKKKFKKKSKKTGIQINTLYKCPECSKVWEIYYGCGREFISYQDMPSYGLKKSKCKNCKGDNNG